MPKRAPWMTDQYVIQERYPPRSPRGIWRDIDRPYSTREGATEEVAKRRAANKKQAAWEKENGYSPNAMAEYRIVKR